MPQEPVRKRAIAYLDGQNLFYAVKYAYGYSWPNYDPLLLANQICKSQNWELQQTRFYTGYPSAQDDPSWNHFWAAKFSQMGREGVVTFSRPLKYRNQTVQLPGGGATTVLVGSEKGIDVRLALDIVAAGRRGDYDVALVFSQDQDLSEVADEVRTISMEDNRWLQIACAFPKSPTYSNTRGINGTNWLPFDRVTYDACIDTRDYRPKK
jgi:uncharacterized LabA/DUF88 family protein